MQVHPVQGGGWWVVVVVVVTAKTRTSNQRFAEKVQPMRKSIEPP